MVLTRKAWEGIGVLKKYISDFSLFIFVPEALVKYVRISIILLDSLSISCPYSITSSTSCWWVRGRSFPYNLRPLYFSFYSLSLMSIPRPLTMRIKKKGDNGSPCLSPLIELKDSIGDLLSRIDRTGVVTIDITQFIYLSLKPNSFSIFWRYLQFSLS